MKESQAYALTLSTDAGFVVRRKRAHSLKMAIRAVCEAEGVDPSRVIYWRIARESDLTVRRERGRVAA